MSFFLPMEGKRRRIFIIVSFLDCIQDEKVTGAGEQSEYQYVSYSTRWHYEGAGQVTLSPALPQLAVNAFPDLLPGPSKAVMFFIWALHKADLLLKSLKSYRMYHMKTVYIPPAAAAHRPIATAQLSLSRTMLLHKKTAL
jgi:hypothetical protein